MIYLLALLTCLIQSIVSGGSSLKETEDLVVRSDDDIELCPHPDFSLNGNSEDPNRFETLKDAWKECKDRDDCGGIIRERSDKFTLRKGTKLDPRPSSRNYIAYRRCTHVTGDVIRKPQNSVEYHFKSRPTPKPGDVIEVEASYNEGVKLDIYEKRPPGMEEGDFVVYVGGGETAVVEVEMEVGEKDAPPVPWGKPFKVQLYFMDDSYMLYVNEVYWGLHKYTAPLKSAKFVMLYGAELKFEWKEIKWSYRRPSQMYSHRDDLKRPIKKFEKKIKKKISRKPINQIRAFASSQKGSIAILKDELLKQLLHKENYVDLRDKNIAWILRSREALELLLTSEGNEREVVNHISYPKVNIQAIQTLANFVRDDPSVKTDPVMLRWAVAMSLAPRYTNSFADRILKIDNVDMYYKKKKWLREGTYFPLTKKLSSWHLRFALAQRQFPSEIEWAHKKCPDENRTPLRVYKNTNLVEYNKKNDHGTSVHDNRKYYYYKPRTLQQVHKVGGVCGACSTFGEAMCRSFGVPSFTVGQPGHCAFVWYNSEEDYWKGSWFVSGWDETYMKVSWYEDRGEKMLAAEYLPLMNELQGKYNKEYRLSEKVRLAKKFAESDEAALGIVNEALLIEPRNVYAWANLRDISCKIPQSKRKRAVQNVLSPNLQRILKSKPAQRAMDVAMGKPIDADSDWYKPERINDGDDDGSRSDDDRSSFKIDLEDVYYKFTEVKFQWWYRCTPDTIKIYARDREGHYTKVATEDDVIKKDNGPDGDGKDAWWTLRGWNQETTKIKVEVYAKEKKDKYYNKFYVGIRKFQPYAVIGISAKEEISKSSPSVNRNKEVEVDLDGIAVISKVGLDWGSKRKPKSLTFLTKSGSEAYKEVKFTSSKDDEYMLDQEAASDLKIVLTGYTGSSVRVTVTGKRFSTQEIMKLMVKSMIPNPRGLLPYAKTAIYQEFVNKICYE